VAELPIVSTGRVAPAETASERKQIVRGGPVLIEQYHRVAAVLDNAQAARGLKRLMVTSALPREGRTSTVVNLALVLSESYARRVLLIDADLRQPSLHGIFGVRSEPGLGEALHGSRQGLPVIEVSPLLSVLPAGQPGEDPLRALASDRMCAVLDECANRFDWVLLDTPPLTLLTDAPLLARRAQAVVFVIGVGSAPFSVAEKAMTALGRASIIGTVLNGLEDRSEQARD
jgi:capsular exopolysaccharide synthesis family protein